MVLSILFYFSPKIRTVVLHRVQLAPKLRIPRLVDLVPVAAVPEAKVETSASRMFEDRRSSECLQKLLLDVIKCLNF